jgi:ferritin-like metal-binding protein YciE
VLGQTKHASLLEKTLAEEKQTDEKLATLATDINTKANEEGSEEQGDSSPVGKKTQKRAA